MAVAGVACVGGLLLAAGVGPSVGDLVDDARDDAQQIREFEASGLTPYLPEIEGSRVEFASASYTGPEGGGRQATGYDLRYKPESTTEAEWDSASISVSIGLVGDAVCEEIEGHLACREGDGYVVTERDGVPDEVAADLGGVRLLATFSDGTGDLPDIDEVGRALADADQVEWEQIVGLDE